MIPVLSREQMRAFDKHAIESCRVPGLVLMENAGRGATDVCVRELLEGDAANARVVVVCGAGNNGGDGLVIARHLLLRGADLTVMLAGDAEQGLARRASQPRRVARGRRRGARAPGRLADSSRSKQALARAPMSSSTPSSARGSTAPSRASSATSCAP